MADELVVGKLRAVLGLDTAQYVAGARTASTVNAKLTAEMKRTQEEIRKFAAGSKDITFKEMTAGMSAAGKQATASAGLIRGMSAAGREAAAANLQVAQTSQTMAQRISALATPLKSMAVGMGAAFAVGAVVNFAKEIGSFAGRMTDLSAETGITTTRLQALNFIAAGAGLTVEDLARAVQQLQRRLAGGDESAERAVEKLGFAVGELLAMAPDEAFIRLGEAIARIESPAERTRVAFELFGRSGTRALRIMTEELGLLVDQTEKSGAIIDEELIKRADRFDDAWTQSILRVKAGLVNLFGTLAAGAAGWRDAFTGALSQDNQFGGRAGDIALPASGSDVVHGRGLPERDPGAAAANAAAERRRQALAAAATAYRAFLNEIGVRELEHIEATRKAEAAAISEIGAMNTEAAAERDRARKADIAAIAEFEDASVRAARSASEAANEVGLSFMEADRRRMEEHQALLDEIREHWLRVSDDITFSITDGFASMLTGLRGFKDAMIDIWRDIRRAIAGILSQMLADFIGGYLRRAVAAMAGTALAGATLGAGTAAAATAGGAGAAGAAGAGGIGATLAGLATNPFTIAAAAGIGLGLLVGKSGWGRGGEEGTKVNPRRDAFIGQFGPSGTGPGSGFANLSSTLRSGQLFGALLGADTVKEFEAAQAAIVMRFSMLKKPIKAFDMGGFVPPGVVQPAILHGGSRGEVVMPVEKMGGVTHVHNWHVSTIDGPSTARFIREQAIPELNRAAERNTGGYATAHRKGLGVRPAYGAR